MQYSTVLLAVMAASGSLAAPWGQVSSDNEVRVVLSDQGETGAQNVFPDGVRAAQQPSQSGPFKTVELQLGKNVKNTNQRCQVLDDTNTPIVLVRGANTDITFSDADKGEWTFRDASKVSQIICDPTFKQIGSDATEIRVILSNQATETGSQTTFTEGQRQEKAPVGSTGPFETVELSVGTLVRQQNLRCQVVDHDNKPIIVLRGENRDITFSDADKGEWTFETVSEVNKIICDPTFEAARV